MYLHFKTKIYINAGDHDLVFFLLNLTFFSLGDIDTGLLRKQIDGFRQDSIMGKGSGSDI